MQSDTTAASSKVGAPVFKLIVVLAQNRHFPPAHPVQKNWPLEQPSHEVVQPWLLELHALGDGEFKGYTARGCWRKLVSLFFLTLDSGDCSASLKGGSS